MSFVAEAEGRPIGFILVRFEYLGIPFTEVWVIHSIVVANEYRRQGIGNRLV